MLSRLDGVLESSRSISDRLLGPRLKDAMPASAPSPIVPSMERLLGYMHERMNEIEAELSRANCGV